MKKCKKIDRGIIKYHVQYTQLGYMENIVEIGKKYLQRRLDPIRVTPSSEEKQDTETRNIQKKDRERHLWEEWSDGAINHPTSENLPL